jgi:hypothetical protein
MSFLLTLILIAFLAGIYFVANYSPKEAFESMSENQRCPNVLIQKDAKFYLFNSKLAKVPGVNPVVFNNLEEYTEFLDWQRGMGIRCPVLYLQHTYDAQGESVYKTRPSVTNPQGGLPPALPYAQTVQQNVQQMNKMNPSQADGLLPQIIEQNDPDHPPMKPNPTLLVDATHDDNPYNTNSYPSYDESSYYIGTTTPLDKMNEDQQNLQISPNPMDPNWGGAKYTQSLVDQGYYAGNEVSIRVA